MTQTQARPDWNAEMDRQIKATESAMALVRDHQATVYQQRKEIERLRGALGALIVKSDNGVWHSSEDCETEKHDQDCELCQALNRARSALVKDKTT